MRERAEPILKIACLILAALVVYQFAGIFLRINPLHGVVVPALPALAASTNNLSIGGRGTNLAASASAVVKGTNNQISAGTNTVLTEKVAGTNSIASAKPIAEGTNSITQKKMAKIETNVVPHLETNSASATTNSVNGTNILMVATAPGTNITHHPKPGMTNANFIPPSGMAGMNFNPASLGKRGEDLPPAVQARISRIVDSEILGPVMHPLPMALLGIAGDVAFLRSASGQTGLVKAGDSLGELKLLKIGVNRVLVEQDGQKKELMIFSGYGGDSLLPKQKETSDENNQP